jgi:hypothetical protein
MNTQNKSVPEVGMIFILFYPTPTYNLYKTQFLSINIKEFNYLVLILFMLDSVFGLFSFACYVY